MDLNRFMDDLATQICAQHLLLGKYVAFSDMLAQSASFAW
jgi:hypothetical protein